MMDVFPSSVKSYTLHAANVRNGPKCLLFLLVLWDEKSVRQKMKIQHGTMLTCRSTTLFFSSSPKALSLSPILSPSLSREQFRNFLLSITSEKDVMKFFTALICRLAVSKRVICPAWLFNLQTEMFILYEMKMKIRGSDLSSFKISFLVYGYHAYYTRW